MIGLIGKKIGMAQIFEKGKVIPVSLIQAGPCPIIQIKNEKKDGYFALQLGYGKKKKSSKPLSGHLKKSKTDPVYRLFEIRFKDSKKFKLGDKIDVSIFKDGETVQVTGWTKGRGFSGGIKRWGWHGGPASHGSMSHRRIGSAGPGSSPGRIWKGKTMPGRYGNEKVTIRNLKVVKIEIEKNLLYLKGAVPGTRNGYLLVIKDET
ncbi:50S ribosomal protein L3 [candidate division WOR-3 bacterium RBG_13_43_14]|uniref:Large ribosomal subunit protein uL3 n=1 Tax=candidate division WOR-3 bacterium RBG_13_43_14 TaxID=1802590 RepID=A0A1F4UDN2_UNCW3|nr:MAG: 50S ribosomal protein L3 [candidate division WOR-3 bacterium RBG_13_43_14]